MTTTCLRRHRPGGPQRAVQRSAEPTLQPRHQWPVPPGLHVQGGARGGGPRGRRHHGEHPRLVRRGLLPGQQVLSERPQVRAAVLLLAPGWARLAERGWRADALLQHLFQQVTGVGDLQGAGDGAAGRGGDRLWVRRRVGDRPPGRGRRPGALGSLEAHQLWRVVAHRRHVQRRDRPGLLAGDAPPGAELGGGDLQLGHAVPAATRLPDDPPRRRVVDALQPEPIRQLPISQANLDLVRQGMRLVGTPQGTAYLLDVPG